MYCGGRIVPFVCTIPPVKVIPIGDYGRCDDKSIEILASDFNYD